MLLDDFYMVREKRITPTGIEVDVVFNELHSIFKAHFPENPVTPGACLIEVLKDILEKHYGNLLFMKTIRNVKFTQVIVPDHSRVITYKLTLKPTDDASVAVSGTIESRDRRFTQMSIIYTRL